ncbi:AAA family ATPase [Nocardia pseudobrasiliensis]|uniref:Putative kinase n=1 Tax=Nocardia pseudobrasiliensis TaxID=45979 RepID=A0A370I4J9_9NOCA|nr:AAA family ATPase [Nocardia pseudobrasiliensis]RDI65656.1 putative kinase [Nocardia pseudobrasiliensis]
MADTRILVLVNGLPGSGKSTLAQGLAHELDACLLSKDRIKEALAADLGDRIAGPALGAIAMDTIWALAAAARGHAVVDSWWYRPRDLEFARAGIALSRASHAVEIWCDVPPGTARERYARRSRGSLYEDERRLAEDWDRWAANGIPLGLTPVLRVDTGNPVDHAAVVRRIGQ